jgi:hypothetical protein
MQEICFPMSFKKDLEKEILYEGVKTLIEHPAKHIHLHQQKLFTLFSVAFQYMLFQSSRNPGHYIIRIEDSFLADKLAKKSKDETTRKFMFKLLVPRRLVYGKSTFHLDYFNLSSWGITKDLPKEKIQAALIVKNTSNDPFVDETDFRALGGEEYYLTTLTEFVPRTITIAFEKDYKDLEQVSFNFISEAKEYVQGVTVAEDLELSDD